MREETYPSDISRAQFEAIRPLLESVRKKTKPREVDLYEVWCALLYLLKGGIQWRMMPKDFPKWNTVYSYFVRWKYPGKQGVSVLEQALRQEVEAARIQDERPALTSFIIVDAQSVKNTDTAECKGYDAGKKVSGIKRHLAVDTQGLPHAIEVTTANVTDRKGALQAVDRCQAHLTCVQSVLVDGGYTGEPFAQAISAKLGASVHVAKRSELHTFAVIPKRWVVERSFAWLEKCRRLWKNCERQINTRLQFIHLAFLVLLLRRS
jgi:transposase